MSEPLSIITAIIALFLVALACDTLLRLLSTLRHIAGLLNSLGEMIGDAIEQADNRPDPARHERR